VKRFTCAILDDQLLALLSEGAPYLESLDVSDFQVSQDPPAAVVFRSLTRLVIRGPVGLRSWMPVAFPVLQSLELDGRQTELPSFLPAVVFPVLERLRAHMWVRRVEFPALQQVELKDSCIETVLNIARKHPQLRSITVTEFGSSPQGSDDIAALVQARPSLQHIILSGEYGRLSKPLYPAAPQLRSISLETDPSTLKQLSQCMPELSSLTVMLSAPALRTTLEFPALPALRQLRIRSGDGVTLNWMSDAVWHSVVAVLPPQLEELDLMVELSSQALLDSLPALPRSLRAVYLGSLNLSTPAPTADDDEDCGSSSSARGPPVVFPDVHTLKISHELHVGSNVPSATRHLQRLAAAFPNIESLRMPPQWPHIGHATEIRPIGAFCTSFPRLHSLANVIRCTPSFATSLARAVPNLRMLSLLGSQLESRMTHTLDDAALVSLAAGLPCLEALLIPRCSLVTDAGIRQLAAIMTAPERCLRSLDIKLCKQLTLESLTALTAVTTLESVSALGTAAADDRGLSKWVTEHVPLWPRLRVCTLYYHLVDRDCSELSKKWPWLTLHRT
jgi:hypothetical protein